MSKAELHNQLAEIGLTFEEAAIYTLLLSKGSLTAKAIAEARGIVVNSVYRATKPLVAAGLVAKLDTRPVQFQAASPSTSITQLINERAQQLQSLGDALVRSLPSHENPNRLNMDVLTGREALFQRFVELAEEARQELLVISIGETVPESVWSATQDAVNKGVQPKFIFHEHSKDNIMLIKRWLAMGVPVRHLPAEGYHLNIFDHAAAILSASNPSQSTERTGAVIYNEAIIEMLRSYFFQQWAVAKKL